MSIDTTIGGANSNSYISVADADTYFTSRLYATDWSSANNATKEAALITATKRLDQETFTGALVTSTQALRWPRAGAEKPDPVGWATNTATWVAYYTPTEIPQRVKDAQCEIALHLLAGDTLKSTGLENFKSLEVGPIKLEMNRPVGSGILPDQAVRLLRGLVITGGSIVRA